MDNPQSAQTTPAISRTGTTKKPVRRKKSLSKWSSFSTVSWRMDAQKDYHEHTKTLSESERLPVPLSQLRCFLLRLRLLRAWHECQVWILPALIGVLIASSGALIELAVELYGGLRFGFCSSNFLLTKGKCGDDWVSFADHGNPFVMYVGISCCLVLVAALLVRYVAPTARGSGIPEVKTILGGFGIDDVLSFKTLVTKIIGLGFSVGAGLSCGKEGPLVHIACCWSNCLAHFVPRWRHNQAKRRELLSTAAAAGVSVAFGAPLGGVLFSFEEVSTMFPSRTMVLAFFAATVASITLDWWNPTGTGKLTLFQTEYNTPPVFPEYIGFVFLGIMGGLIGAFFVHYNIMVCAGRRKGTVWREKVPEVVEVMMICFLTAITSYPNRYTQVLSSTTIGALFHACGDKSASRPDMMDLCDGPEHREPWTDLALSGQLLMAGLLRFVQMIFTFGAGVPAGLFVPCLFTGACLGRVVGFVAYHINSLIPGSTLVINPGVYAMVGAASVLGGVCRVTISLVVIMFELTGRLQTVVPFMCAVLIAKFVGDFFTGGIYDCAIRLRGYPFLHEPDEAAFHKTAADVMDVDLEVMDCEPQSIGEVLQFMRRSPHSGFPLIRSLALGDKTIVGFVHKDQIMKHLQDQLKYNQLLSESNKIAFQPRQCPMDLSHLVDGTVYRVVKDMPVKEVHGMFRKLGLKLILVEEAGRLVGMITKKSFIEHVDEMERADVEGTLQREFTGSFGLEQPLLEAEESPASRTASGTPFARPALPPKAMSS